jgi:hypothetical protein
VTSDVVPGRLGSKQGKTPYANAYPTAGGMCNKVGHCSMQANGDGAVSCKGRGKDWNFPITVWRGQIKQAESFAPSNMHVSDNNNSNGKRVGHIGPNAGVTFTSVYAGAAGTNNLVVYYSNGDCPVGNLRYFNVKVNGGPSQNRAFPSNCGDWSEVNQMMITLSGFTAGSTNKVEFFADGQHAAPDLDWIEVVQSATTASGTSGSTSTGTTGSTTSTACAVGKTVALKAVINGKYASARQDANNDVKAQSGSVGTWEQFQIVDAGGGFVALKSKMNNQYVAAESNGQLRARSGSIGGWEKFKLELQSDGYYAIKANTNGKFVSARADQGNAPMQAVAGSAGSWEDFQCQ